MSQFPEGFVPLNTRHAVELSTGASVKYERKRALVHQIESDIPESEQSQYLLRGNNISAIHFERLAASEWGRFFRLAPVPADFVLMPHRIDSFPLPNGIILRNRQPFLLGKAVEQNISPLEGLYPQRQVGPLEDDVPLKGSVLLLGRFSGTLDTPDPEIIDLVRNGFAVFSRPQGQYLLKVGRQGGVSHHVNLQQLTQTRLAYLLGARPPPENYHPIAYDRRHFQSYTLDSGRRLGFEQQRDVTNWIKAQLPHSDQNHYMLWVAPKRQGRPRSYVDFEAFAQSAHGVYWNLRRPPQGFTRALRGIRPTSPEGETLRGSDLYATARWLEQVVPLEQRDEYVHRVRWQGGDTYYIHFERFFASEYWQQMRASHFSFPRSVLARRLPPYQPRPVSLDSEAWQRLHFERSLPSSHPHVFSDRDFIAEVQHIRAQHDELRDLPLFALTTGPVHLEEIPNNPPSLTTSYFRPPLMGDIPDLLQETLQGHNLLTGPYTIASGHEAGSWVSQMIAQMIADEPDPTLERLVLLHPHIHADHLGRLPRRLPPMMMAIPPIEAIAPEGMRDHFTQLAFLIEHSDWQTRLHIGDLHHPTLEEDVVNFLQDQRVDSQTRSEVDPLLIEGPLEIGHYANRQLSQLRRVRQVGETEMRPFTDLITQARRRQRELRRVR